MINANGGGNCKLPYFLCLDCGNSVYEYHPRHEDSADTLCRPTPLLVDVFCAGSVDRTQTRKKLFCCSSNGFYNVRIYSVRD